MNVMHVENGMKVKNDSTERYEKLDSKSLLQGEEYWIRKDSKQTNKIKKFFIKVKGNNYE